MVLTLKSTGKMFSIMIPTKEALNHKTKVEFRASFCKKFLKVLTFL